MGYAAHLLILTIVNFLLFGEAQNYFPKSRNFVEKSDITASSTCGETESSYCDARTLSRYPRCTFKICKKGCCPTCTTVSPAPVHLSNDKNKYNSTYESPPRPGANSPSVGFDVIAGSYIKVDRLPVIDSVVNGFAVCAWVNQTSGNEG